MGIGGAGIERGAAAGGAVVVAGYKTGNTGRQNNATPSDDPHIVGIELDAGVYTISGFLTWNPGAGGFRFAVQSSIAPIAETLAGMGNASTGTVANPTTFPTIAVSPTSAVVTSTSGSNALHLMGFVEFDAAAVIDLQWAQNVSNAATTTLVNSSWLAFTLVP